jgi:hypothetical protein
MAMRSLRVQSEKAAGGGRVQAPAAIAGRYVLLDQLGAGGMGAVHRARDERTGQFVALKQLLTSLTGSRRRMVETMFEREYHTLVRLKHPRVIEVYDYGLSEAGPYYTMELLEGKDLQQSAPLPYAVACGYLRDIASLLALMATHRLVHRDISPRNVRFGADGRAKLIDFGALHPFGPVMDIVGTPPCMAPEVLSKTVLDQRTDLFALGAVAYFALTGRHAYPARRLDELPRLWLERPAPPSQFAPDIPPALDELVLSLLRVNPLARPAHPATVIDELSAIGNLPSDDSAVAAESYLLSGRMIGRDVEQVRLAEWLSRTVSGRGGEVVVEGAAGVGKTRLLQEAALDAQLRGMTVLRADGQGLSRPYGVANALCLQLLAASPEQGLAAAQPHAGVLAHLSDELREALGRPALERLPAAPPERRARFQAALHGWFSAIAKQQPLLLSIDNLQAVEDNSAAFLAALGFEARTRKLLIICSQRADDEVQAPSPVRELRGRAERVELGNLNLEQCIELVRSLFGDVANADRLAGRLHAHSRGNPQQLTDLAELLVKHKIASYVGGAWVLPLEVSDDELPRESERLLAVRLGDLGPSARALLDAISPHDRPVSLELVLALAAAMGMREPATVHAALSELGARQMLVLEGDRYRFARDSLRQGLLAQMDEEARRALYRQLSACLLARPADDLGAHLMGARHLLSAGDTSRGAELLAELAHRALRVELLDESPDQVVQSLNAALEIFEAEGRSPRARAELMIPMVSMAYYTREWRLLLSHGEALVRLGAELFGLRRARKLRPVVGAKLALLVSVLCAAVLFAFARRGGRGAGFLQAFERFVVALTAIGGTLVLVNDAEGLDRIADEVEPLRWLGKETPLAFAYRFIERLSDLAHARYGPPYADFEPTVAWLHSPALSKVFDAEHRKTVYGGMLCGRAVSLAYRFGEGALQAATQAEELGIRMWAVGAAQGRMLYHALRGESDAVQRYRAETELAAVQGGTTWQLELAAPVWFLQVYVLVADTIAMRQLAEQLTRRARKVAPLQVYAELAQAIYLGMRGQLPEALAAYEQVASHFRPFQRAGWHAFYAGYAQTLIRSGQHTRARDLLTEALDATSPSEAEFVALHLELKRQLALAEAGLQHRGKAAALLDTMLERHGAETNPLLVGLLHKARAEVALMTDDVDAFTRHFAEFETRFRATGNPALIAQSDRLAGRGRKAGVRAVTSAPPASRTSVGTYFSTHEADLAADPFAHVLRVIVRHARAKGGYLYTFEQDALRLVAATSSDEAPLGLETQLREASCDRSLLASQAAPAGTVGVESTQIDTTSVEPAAPAPADQGEGASDDVVPTDMIAAEAASEAVALNTYCVRALHVRRDGKLRVVGGLILEPDPSRPLALPNVLLEEAAEFLHSRGGVLSSAL